jgi:hypothetical protein
MFAMVLKSTLKTDCAEEVVDTVDTIDTVEADDDEDDEEVEDVEFAKLLCPPISERKFDVT